MAGSGIRKANVLCVVASLAVLGSFASAEPSNKWRIEFNHSTDNAGEVVFRITPLNGTPVDVTFQFEKGITENQAAQQLRKSFTAALGKAYSIDVDDFEAVVIKKAGKTPKFDLIMASSTVSGLSIDIKRK